MVQRVHHGSFGPKMATEIRTFSMLGPHSGTNLSDLAKIVPGTFMVILILHVKKTQFGTEKAFCVKKFLDFKNQLTPRALCFCMDLRWVCVICLDPRWSCLCCLGPYLYTVTLDLSRTQYGNLKALKD